MKTIALLVSLLALTVACSSTAEAGHSTGNNTCNDDAVHYQNMIVNGKRSDAPLYNKSKETRDLAIEQKVQGNWEKCEELMEEALRMIRKPYPSE
tara:strand:+ start:113 stop:397 length:285 start_codon:yes stop_codon:yes gene_type:complete